MPVKVIDRCLSQHLPRRSLPTVSKRKRQLTQVVTTALGWLSFVTRRDGGAASGISAAAMQARKNLLQEMQRQQPDTQRISDACDELIAAKMWTSSVQQTGRVARAADNQAWQDFDPDGRTLVNFGEILGRAVNVTASGTYNTLDDQQHCPKMVRASITSGALQCYGVRVPLPIRGEGLVEVGYLDGELRIFRATNGSVSLQVRQDRLQQLVGWPPHREG